MYSEFTGGKNNDPIAGRNMFYNPAERMWIREFKFHLKQLTYTKNQNHA